MGAGQELVSRRTRGAFRDACSDYAVVRQIERAFEDEGIDPAGDDRAPQPGVAGSWFFDGQRRGTFSYYAASVDWGNAGQVRRALNVFEQVLTWARRDEEGRIQLVRHLERDGYRVDEAGRIRSGASAALAGLPLEHLRDPAAIVEHLDRLATAADTDPPLAVSGAKALVEATAKLVLTELGQPVDEQADVPALVKAANKALRLDPRDVAPSATGAETVTRVLANLAQIPTGLAQLRNQYGPDHGRSTPTVGLAPRHAHLAVGASATYCRFLLDTLAARRAKQS